MINKKLIADIQKKYVRGLGIAMLSESRVEFSVIKRLEMHKGLSVCLV